MDTTNSRRVKQLNTDEPDSDANILPDDDRVRIEPVEPESNGTYFADEIIHIPDSNSVVRKPKLCIAILFVHYFLYSVVLAGFSYCILMCNFRNLVFVNYGLSLDLGFS